MRSGSEEELHKLEAKLAEKTGSVAAPMLSQRTRTADLLLGGAFGVGVGVALALRLAPRRSP